MTACIVSSQSFGGSDGTHNACRAGAAHVEDSITLYAKSARNEKVPRLRVLTLSEPLNLVSLNTKPFSQRT